MPPERVPARPSPRRRVADGLDGHPVYEHPNPFDAVNWGFPGDQHQPAEAEAIRYVTVEATGPAAGRARLAHPDTEPSATLER
jgi:hypothetical protein